MQKIINFYKNTIPPVRWLIGFIVAVLTLSFIFAPEPQPTDWDQYSAQTTSDSRLYFHNIRSFFYHRYPEEKPPMILYRLKDRVQDSTAVQLHFTIVQNPLTDEAFTVSEWQNMPVKSNRDWQFQAIAQGDTTTFSLGYFNASQEYRLASVVYLSLQKEGRFYLASENKGKVKVLHKASQRESVETVLEDYFKLIRKLKT